MASLYLVEYFKFEIFYFMAALDTRAGMWHYSVWGLTCWGWGRTSKFSNHLEVLSKAFPLQGVFVEVLFDF